MPVYDVRCNETIGPPPMEPAPPGSEPFPRFDGKPGMLLDAQGAVIEWVIRCNTETGEVERYDVRGTDGSRRWQTDPVTKRVVVLREIHPAPLRYVRRVGASGTLKLEVEKTTATPEWDFTTAPATADVKGFAEYPKSLDQEMIDGACFPKEVVQSSESGSGYNGRLNSIPPKPEDGSSDMRQEGNTVIMTGAIALWMLALAAEIGIPITRVPPPDEGESDAPIIVGE